MTAAAPMTVDEYANKCTRVGVLRLLKTGRFDGKSVESMEGLVRARVKAAVRAAPGDVGAPPSLPPLEATVGATTRDVVPEGVDGVDDLLDSGRLVEATERDYSVRIPSEGAAGMFFVHPIGRPSTRRVASTNQRAVRERRSRATRAASTTAPEQCRPSCFAPSSADAAADGETTERCTVTALAVYSYLTGATIQRLADRGYNVDGTPTIVRFDRRGPWLEEWTAPPWAPGTRLLLVQSHELVVFDNIEASDAPSPDVRRLNIPDGVRFVLPIDMTRAVTCWPTVDPTTIEGLILGFAHQIVVGAPLETHNLHASAARDGALDAAAVAPGLLRAHQRETIDFCKRNFDATDELGGGALVFMGMGMGKTITSVNLAREIGQEMAGVDAPEDTFVLVLGPKALHTGFRNWIVDPSTTDDDGSFPMATKAIHETIELTGRIAGFRGVFVPHSTVRAPSLGEAEVDAIIKAIATVRQGGATVVLVVDEAHHATSRRLDVVRNVPDNRLVRFCARVGPQVKYRIYLSGTPFTNTANDVDGLVRLASNRSADVEPNLLWGCDPSTRRRHFQQLNVSIAWLMTRSHKFPVQRNIRHQVAMKEIPFRHLREFRMRELHHAVMSLYRAARSSQKISAAFFGKLRRCLTLHAARADAEFRAKIEDAFRTYDENAQASDRSRQLFDALDDAKIWEHEIAGAAGPVHFWAEWEVTDTFYSDTRKFLYLYDADDETSITFYAEAVPIMDDSEWPPVPPPPAVPTATALVGGLPACFERVFAIIDRAVDAGSLPIVIHCSVLDAVYKFYKELRGRLATTDRDGVAISSYTCAYVTGDRIKIGDQTVKRSGGQTALEKLQRRFGDGLVDVLVVSDVVSEGVSFVVGDTPIEWSEWDLRATGVDDVMVRRRRVTIDGDVRRKKGEADDENEAGAGGHWRRVDAYRRRPEGVDVFPHVPPGSSDGLPLFVRNRLSPVRQFCHMNMTWNFAHMRQVEARVIRDDSHPLQYDAETGEAKFPLTRGEVEVHTVVTARRDNAPPVCETTDERMEQMSYRKDAEIGAQVEKVALSEPRDPKACEALAQPLYRGVDEDSAASQRIVLDAKPLGPRPDALLPHALGGTDLPARPAIARVFGEWTFDYGDIDPATWHEAVPQLRANITRLFHEGRIRYGSWEG